MEEKEIVMELRLIREQLSELSQGIALLLNSFYKFEYSEPDRLTLESPIELNADKKQEPQQLELELPDEDDDEPKFFCPSYIG